MAPLPQDVDTASRPHTGRCGYCLQALHGPVAFCPYCGTPGAAATAGAVRTTLPSAAPVAAPALVAPTPQLPETGPATATQAAAPIAASAAERPRPDPQAPARWLVAALAVLVLVLTAVIVRLAFFDQAPGQPGAPVPPELATTPPAEAPAAEAVSPPAAVQPTPAVPPPVADTTLATPPDAAPEPPPASEAPASPPDGDCPQALSALSLCARSGR